MKHFRFLYPSSSFVFILFGLCTSALPLSLYAAAPLIPDDWTTNWSGLNGHPDVSSTDLTPSGEKVLQWTWNSPDDKNLPSMGRSFPTAPLSGDTIGFWLKTDQPLDHLQVILTDEDNVGSENNIATLLNTKTIVAGKWHYVVWAFRSQLGWVRYGRGQVNWDRIKGFMFQGGYNARQPQVKVEIGPPCVRSFDELEKLFEKDPDCAVNNRALAWWVLTGERTDRMMPRYHQMCAEKMVAELRAKYPPANFIKSEDEIRKRLAAAYLMPLEAGEKPEATSYGTVELDGIKIEKQLLKLRDGVYSTALIFLPADPDQTTKRYPAILMLPGHGDPFWSPSVQSRCLSFAKRGFVVMCVQPFGQGERGDNSRWIEDHDSQATAYLIPTGQNLMGLIMADHESELTYLASRADVDPARLGVTGVSMGGTHSIWLSAIDTRLRVAVPDAAAFVYDPHWSFRHGGLCDLIIGAYKIADQEMMIALSAPRAFLQIYPNSETPFTIEGARLFNEGWISFEDGLLKYACNDAQIAELHRFPHEVYNLCGVPNDYDNRVIGGPHDYNQAMREVAAGWLGHFLQGREGIAPIAEATLTPSKDIPYNMATFNFWPSGNRPAAMLGPTAYTQREAKKLVDRLPESPKSADEWQKLRKNLQAEVNECLGVELSSPNATVKEVGKARADHGAIHKLVVEPEAGIELPMLLFAPDDGATPNGRLVVMLAPEGMLKSASSPERQALTRDGAWVLCVDLRGMGETRYDRESGGYEGFHDLDISMNALKLGNTLAGYWIKDLFSAIQSAQKIIGSKLKVTVRAEREMGLVAILAASQNETIDAVETKGLLASYYSPKGYGTPFVYCDENNSKAVRNLPIKGYGSALPCIPHILEYADIAQLAAMVAPRTLVIENPLWASNDPLSTAEIDSTFRWTQKIYKMISPSSLKLSGDHP